MTGGRFRGLIPLAIFVAFIAGALVDGWLRTYGPPKPVKTVAEAPDAFIAAPSKSKTPAPAPVATTGDIPHGRLRVPLDGSDIESFKGGFAERRDGTRPHEAVDMLAPRNTPVHAVAGGTIAKLFTSKAGGLTIYQFDDTGRLCYYYAHLERYADGLKDGQAIAQGDVIGYVGTTGNAPANTPHLHFAVFELNADKKWWQGKPLDPYLVFKDRG
jgi:murein DD-endopeptidase MepM/ murein hydrolase activator NlpD